jgi:hypothetical protein
MNIDCGPLNPGFAGCGAFGTGNGERRSANKRADYGKFEFAADGGVGGVGVRPFGEGERMTNDDFGFLNG